MEEREKERECSGLCVADRVRGRLYPNLPNFPLAARNVNESSNVCPRRAASTERLRYMSNHLARLRVALMIESGQSV